MFITRCPVLAAVKPVLKLCGLKWQTNTNTQCKQIFRGDRSVFYLEKIHLVSDKSQTPLCTEEDYFPVSVASMWKTLKAIKWHQWKLKWIRKAKIQYKYHIFIMLFKKLVHVTCHQLLNITWTQNRTAQGCLQLEGIQGQQDLHLKILWGYHETWGIVTMQVYVCTSSAQTTQGKLLCMQASFQRSRPSFVCWINK